MCQNVSRCVLNVIVAIVIGVAVGVLFNFGFLTGVVALWGAFVIGVVGIAALVGVKILSSCSACKIRCCKESDICLAIGSIGAIAASLLSISIAGIGAVLAAIIAGLVGFFTALVLLGLLDIALDARSCCEKSRY